MRYNSKEMLIGLNISPVCGATMCALKVRMKLVVWKRWENAPF